MPTNKERALSLLYDKLMTGQRYTSAELVEVLERNDLTVSERSLSRWLQQLREEYDLPVQFDQRTRRHHVTEADRQAQPTSLLKYTDSQFLRDTLLRNKKAAQVIEPDNRAPALNHHHFGQLVTVCLEHRLVALRHQKFDAAEPKNYLLQPFFLKEYLYRWYLIAADTADEHKIKAFGLERILEAQPTDQKFNPKKREQAAEQFVGLMGITGAEIKPYEVVLRTNQLQKEFFRTLPLHERQKIIELPDGRWEISFIGKPNLELAQQLVGQLEPIEVVEPAWFRQYVIDYLKRNLEPYGESRPHKGKI